MKNILATGGSGFIGSHFVDQEIEDYHIVNLDKLTYAGNLENNVNVKDNPNYTFIKGDINNVDLLEHIIKDHKITQIVHFAAETHVDRSINSPGEFMNSNILGTFNLLNAAKKFGLRFHQVSTDEVFGSLKLEDPMFTENSPYDPKSPYSAAKASADHLVMAYHNTFGLHTTISHCGNNFGPRQYPEKLIPLAINRLLDGQKVPVYGTGKNIRDWIYVKDHCEAISRIIMDGKSGERYCVSGRNEMTNLEIVSQIVKLLGKDFNDSVNYVKDRAGHDFRYAISDEKIKTELGFMPAYQFKETLAHTVQWYIYEHNAKRNKLMVETYKMI